MAVTHRTVTTQDEAPHDSTGLNEIGAELLLRGRKYSVSAQHAIHACVLPLCPPSSPIQRCTFFFSLRNELRRTLIGNPQAICLPQSPLACRFALRHIFQCCDSKLAPKLTSSRHRDFSRPPGCFTPRNPEAFHRQLFRKKE
ncbi:hypothetical protein TcCL_NonESM10235 [Trypanosoma cruzi]|nr:hypothetical protein TcCL_NonESM10235 [Trypanosoma cruzi]